MVGKAENVDIEGLRQAYAATTQGEWTKDFIPDDDVIHLYGGEKSETQIGVLQNWGGTHEYEGIEGQANALFTVEIHNVLPALLDELEYLRTAAHKEAPSTSASVPDIHEWMLAVCRGETTLGFKAWVSDALGDS